MGTMCLITIVTAMMHPNEGIKLIAIPINWMDEMESYEYVYQMNLEPAPLYNTVFDLPIIKREYQCIPAPLGK